MSAPTVYTISYDFTSFQSANPSAPLPADRLEIELENIVTTTDEIISNLGLLQRSDGELSNSIVKYDSLDVSVTGILSAGFTPKGNWTTSTSYVVGDLVKEGTNAYVCAVAHTSGTFATDETAGKWNLSASTTAVNQNITDIGNLTPTDSSMIVGNGSEWVQESGSTLRTSLGLGTGDSPQFTGINVGHASDSLIARVSAGVLSIGGSAILMASNIGSTVQGYSAKLKSIADLTLSGNKMIYATGANTFASTDLTASARTLLGGADASAMRGTLETYSQTEINNLRQIVSTEIITVDTYTSSISEDDTIPQNTEGDEVITRTITPTNTSNKIRVRGILYLSSTSTPRIVLSLFKDSDVNAIAVSSDDMTNNGRISEFNIDHEFVAGTVSEIDIKLRVGQSAGTTTINGVSGSRRYGGKLISKLIVEEYKV